MNSDVIYLFTYFIHILMGWQLDSLNARLHTEAWSRWSRSGIWGGISIWLFWMSRRWEDRFYIQDLCIDYDYHTYIISDQKTSSARGAWSVRFTKSTMGNRRGLGWQVELLRCELTCWLVVDLLPFEKHWPNQIIPKAGKKTFQTTSFSFFKTEMKFYSTILFWDISEP